VVVIAHKAVSKAEGAVVALADIDPSARAQELAAEQGKDARAVQVVLDALPVAAAAAAAAASAREGTHA